MKEVLYIDGRREEFYIELKLAEEIEKCRIHTPKGEADIDSKEMIRLDSFTMLSDALKRGEIVRVPDKNEIQTESKEGN